MAVRIDGNNDLINAADGSLTIEGISVNVVGVSTASGGFKVGTAYTVFPNGNVATAGVITATSLITQEKIIHASDADTFMSFPSADTIRFEAGGAARLIISSGNILQQSGTFIVKNATSDSSGLKLSQESGDESRIFNHFSGPLTFGTANSEKMRITNGGLVGINETSPRHHLTVNSGTTNVAIAVSSTDAGSFISYQDNTTGDTGSNSEVYAGATGGSFVIHTDAQTIPRVTVTNGGKVGISSQIPTKFLDVVGSDGTGLVQIRNLASSFSNDCYTLLIDNTTHTSNMSSAGSFAVETSDTGHGTRAFTIAGDGDVGIGTANPDGALTIAHSGTSTDMLMFNRPGSVGTFARMGHNTSSGTNMLDIRSEGHTRFLTNGNNESMRITSGNDVIIGGTSVGDTGSFGVQSSGAFRSILAASTASDTLCGAISGVSNGFQINITDANAMTYSFHTGSQVSQRINSSGATLFGTTNWPTGSFGATYGRVIVGNEGLLTVYNETNGAFSGGTLKLTCKEGGDATKVGFVNMVGGTVNTSDQKAFFKMELSNDAGSGVEFFRIQEGGNGGRFMLNHTDTSSYNANFSVRHNSSGPYPIGAIGQSTNQGLIGFFAGDGTLIGSIAKSGSSVQYNTTSDYRLKENDASISDGITRIKQLRPIRFNWKDFPEKGNQDGFFAHEVSSVVPEAVTGEKDGIITQEYIDDGKELQSHLGKPIIQSLDHSKLVPLLTAALQEAVTKIETLETKVAALEGG